MFAVLVVIHLLISAALVIVILLQAGRGGGLAGAFGGGGGSQTIFGGRGAATFLSKSTAFLGAAFMISSLTLALLSTRTPVRTQRSVIDEVIRREGQEQQSRETLPEPVPGAQQQPGQAEQPGQTQQAPEAGRPTPGAGVVPSGALPAPGAATEQQKKVAPESPPSSKPESGEAQPDKQGEGASQTGDDGRS